MNSFLILEHALMSAAVVLPRLATMLIILPFINQDILSGPQRNSIILALALVLSPMIVPTMPHPFDLVLIGLVMLKEVLIGVVLGFAISLFFWGIQSIGYFIDNQRGLNNAAMTELYSGDETSPIGVLLMQVTLVIFFSSGGFLALLEALFDSYQIWPVFSFFPTVNDHLALQILAMVDHMMGAVILFSAPLVLAMFLGEISLGLMNRFAQQLNVFSLSMAVKSAIASLLMVFYLRFLMKYLDAYLLDFRQITDFLKGVLHE